MKAVALLRFYFKISISELNNLEIEDFAEIYLQLVYALEFDAARSSGETSKIIMPL